MNYDERRAAEAAFPGVVAKIVAELPGDWRLEQTTPQAVRLTRTTDRLELSCWFSGERIEVKPAPPTLNDGYRSLRDWGVIPYNGTSPSMTAALDREPRAIARDIVRKVLTPYAPLYVEIIAKRDQITTEQNKAAELAKIVAARLDRDRDLRHHTAGHDYNISLPTIGNVYGDVRISSYGSAEIKLRSLNVDQTMAVLDLIDTWKRQASVGGTSEA